LAALAGIVALAAITAGPAKAQCDTWNIGGGGNWFGASGWSSGDPNSSGTSACITNGSSTVTLNNTATVANLTLANGNTLNMGSNYLFIAGTSISNGGIINNSDGVLQLQNNVALSGAGTINMSNGAWINQSSGGLTLTNQDNLIQGDGQLGLNGLSLDNQASGVINANNSGATLYLNGGGAVNNEGLLEASNNGTLQISNNVTNTGANITADNGTVNVSAAINGGTLNTLNGGVMQTNGVATLNGVTLSANSIYGASGGTTYLQGTITNNGTITVPNGTLQVNGGNVTLMGGGTVTMSSDAYFNQTSGGLTLHNVDNTIQGTGQLGENGLTLDNQSHGQVLANVSGGTLDLNGGGLVTNAGLLEATGGGILQISNNVTNTGANITADGGTVNVSAAINGGTLNTLNGGVMQTNGVATLNGVTLSANSTYGASGGTTYLQGTITNNGAITVPNGTLQVLGGDVTLRGGGTVMVSSDAYFNQNTGGLTLHNVDNTIEGTGQLGENGLALDNQSHGQVLANVSGGTLDLNGGGLVTNAGLLEATGGGILQISNNVTNTSNITADGGTVYVGSATITGGTLNTLHGGIMQSNGSAVLNNLTLSSGTTFGDEGLTYLKGTITNKGNITVPNTTLQVLGGDVTLQGGGTVTMSSDAFFNQNTGGLTLHNVDNTIQGTGQFGQNGLSIDNQLSGTIMANTPGDILYINGGGTLSNAGTLKATDGGRLVVYNVSFPNFSGTTLTGGTYVVNGTNGASTLQIYPLGYGGGEIQTSDATITLIGQNADVKFVDAGGHNALSNLDNNRGELDLEQGYTFDAPAGDFTNSGSVLVDGSSAFDMGAGDDYNQSGGETQVDGTLSATTVNINGGVLAGAGTISGDVTNGGTVQPGDNLNVPTDPPGELTIGGDYTQIAGGIFLEDIGGVGDASLLNVGGDVTLNSISNLTVNLLNGFDPMVTEDFLFLTYGGTLNGIFSLTDASIDPYGTFSVDYSTAGQVSLDFSPTPTVPEPSSVVLLCAMGLGLALFVYARRRLTA
jgi:hypothetical protein